MKLKKMTNKKPNPAHAKVNSGAVTKIKKRRNPFACTKEEKERRQKKRARLIVRNISYKITDEALRQHFEQWGELDDVNILKREDGKLVGCAFVQYETISHATKALLNANGKPLLGRPVYVDWAVGKDTFVAKQNEQATSEEKSTIKDEAIDMSVKEESDEDSEEKQNLKSGDTYDSEAGSSDSDSNANIDTDEKIDTVESEDEAEDDTDELKSKLEIQNVEKEKHISNDVKEGCTIFLKNVPFDAEESELRKVCRKFGPIYYAIINRERISGHSKGTAFVKFKAKESADLCLEAGTEFSLMDQVLDPHPALSKEEISFQKAEKAKRGDSKDTRNLYLAREGLIMSGSKAAEDVSTADMAMRHRLERVKTEMLKNLNRFVSRNRLSIHNLPLNYDNEKLKRMAISYTGFTPHECRVMRENKITPEHPKGKSKGFGFLSFNTHQEALTALRKLNNNPNIFGKPHRPIVAFSIEDRGVHKIKKKREEKSKLNNPTFQAKLVKRKEIRKQKVVKKAAKSAKATEQDNKIKLKKQIKKLEKARADQANDKETKQPAVEYDNYVGMAAKQGTSIRMRSNKKINEQAQEHTKRVKTVKRKLKQKKIKQAHLAERKAIDRPKQGHKVERDELKPLVDKYKRMINKIAANDSAIGNETTPKKVKKPKRTKWYKE